jgi:hypothetical protein
VLYFILIFADMYDIMDYLVLAVWVIMPFRPPSSSSVLRSRDESSPELRGRRVVACHLELILHISYSWTLIFDVTGSHAENL